MAVEFLQPTDPEWSRLLGQVNHDFFHHEAYLTLEAERLHGTATCAVVVDGDRVLLVPLILRSLEGLGLGVAAEASDAVSPYGYATPLVSTAATASPEWLDEAGHALKASLATRGVCSGFFRLHPVIPTDHAWMAKVGTVVDEGPSVVIDLNRSADDHWKATRKTTRSLVRKAEAAGFSIEWDRTTARGDEFIEVYLETMARVGATADLNFSRAYMSRVLDMQEIGLRLYVALSPDGDLAAGAMITIHDGVSHYYLAGTRDSFRAWSPMRLLLHAVRSELKEDGVHTFHLGGGLGAREDDLYRFKAGFSSDTVPYRTWRLIADPVAYEATTEALGRTSEGVGGWFPAYRNPG